MTAAKTSQLLDDLTSATNAVHNNHWHAGSGFGSVAAQAYVPSSTTSPLSALTTAGFGWATPFVSFLEEPLTQLAGNPGSGSSSSQGLQDAGQSAASLADDYQQSARTQTTGWSGTAASNYQDAAKQLTDGINAIGQASTGLSGAVSGAVDAVAGTQQAVTELIGEAITKITPILTQAVAAAQPTFGASIMAAIPQIVQIAEQYGQQIAEKMQTLLSSGQNLMGLVQSLAQGAEQVAGEIHQLVGGTGTTGDGQSANAVTESGGGSGDYSGDSSSGGYSGGGDTSRTEDVGVAVSAGSDRTPNIQISGSLLPSPADAAAVDARDTADTPDIGEKYRAR